VKEIIKSVLNLPKEFVPMAFFTVGYPMELPKAPIRKNLDKIIYNLQINKKN